MTLGERIKKRRRELNITQESLGDLLEVHSNTIRKWEKGLSNPDAEELKNIAEALKTTTAYLYGDFDNFSNNENTLFVKNSIYQDKAEKSAENGRNLDVIINLVKAALKILENATRNNTALSDLKTTF